MKNVIFACTTACVLSASLALAQNGNISAPAAATAGAAGTLADGAAPPTIDGQVNDVAWQTVAPFTSFTQQDPRQGEPATEKTEVRLLFSKTHVYVSFICFDSDPSTIIVSQARRDASLTDTDSVVLVFDTFNDNQNAFVFGTNPLGIEYDGQVAREGQSSGIAAAGQGGGGVGRGTISAFNPNWDGDWVVRAGITERGWEAEMAIPLKTLRYAAGNDKTWGFNVMRNIRHKNEQVYLAPIPRGFDIYRVSLATKVTGLNLSTRRDVKLIPYVLGSTNKDFTRSDDQIDNKAEIGADLKWGIRPNLTLDVTVNTDFAQVEADEEQVNLTRFDLFFPEKRPFFLENASTFQFGQPQQIDLFFSRRIGLSGAAGSLQPIDILGGARLSGKVAGNWNVGVLEHPDQRRRGPQRPADCRPTPTSACCARSGKSGGRATAACSSASTSPATAPRRRLPTGTAPTAWTPTSRCRPTSASRPSWRAPTRRAPPWAASPAPTAMPWAPRSATSRAAASTTSRNNLWQVSAGYSQVGDNFNPEVGFLPRKRLPPSRSPRSSSSRSRRTSSGSAASRRTISYNSFYGFDDKLQSSNMHVHPFEIQPTPGRALWLVLRPGAGQPAAYLSRSTTATAGW